MEEITAYVTKYALTKGIFKVTGLLHKDGRLAYKIDSFYSYLSPSEFFELKEVAIRKADGMRFKKIESLKKQIARLEKLNFEVG